MSNVLPGRAVFAGCARDCAQWIGYVLNNMLRLSQQFRESVFILAHNDSSDPTGRILHDFSRVAPAQILSFDGLTRPLPCRSDRLAFARNACVSLARDAFDDFDYLIVFDCDDINATPIDPEAFRKAVRFLESSSDNAAVFSNERGTYFDLWALRHPGLCPGDVWEEVCDLVVREGLSDKEAFSRTFAPRLFSLDPAADPVEVDSAFGGLGIYKLEKVLDRDARYSGHKEKLLPPGPHSDQAMRARWEICEHAPFNLGLREAGGRLWIAPWLINRHTTGVSFPPDAWRSLLHPIPDRT